MEKINRIAKGLNQDLDPRYQPDDTVRDSLNGTIVTLGNDRFAWRPLGSTELLFSLNPDEKIYGHCRLRFRLILLTMEDGGLTRLREVNQNLNDEGATTHVLWQETDNPFNLSMNFPIRSMIGFYESEEIQRIYFTDDNNQPKVLSIGNGLTVNINPKFTEFFPVISNVFGRFSFRGIVPGGNLKAGNYFMAWQYYTEDGYFTDWSYLTNPISVTGSLISSTNPEDYQDTQGQGPGINTLQAIEFRIDDIDTDYSNIRIAAFYTDDLNTAGPGEVFFDSKITGETMDIIYRGGENAGTVLIDDLTFQSILIEKVKDMTIAKKRNVIANLKERDELNIASQVNAEIGFEFAEIVLDHNFSPGLPPLAALFASPHVGRDRLSNILRAGMWYKVTSFFGLTWTDSDSVVHTQTSEERFKPNLPGIINSGFVKQIIRKKLYRINSSVPGAPTNLFAVQFIGFIRLIWTDTTSKETGYRIYWETVPPGSNGTIELPANTITYDFIEPDHTILYEFYVVAFNLDGESSPSNTVESNSLPPIPGQVVDLVASNDQVDQIELTWTNPGTWFEQGFTLQYKRKLAFPPIWNTSALVIGPGSNNAIFIPEIGPNQYVVYEFRIRAYNQGGNAPWSNIAEGRAVPTAPTVAPSNFTATQPNTCQGVVLTWDGVQYAAYYRIERLVGPTWTLIEGNVIGNTYQDNSPDVLNKHNELFAYRVQACNTAGCGPYASTSITVTCIGSPPFIPAIIALFQVVPGDPVTIQWTQGPVGTNYILERNIGFGPWTAIYSGSSDTYDDATVPSFQTCYRVTADTGSGYGPYSAQQCLIVN